MKKCEKLRARIVAALCGTCAFVTLGYTFLSSDNKVSAFYYGQDVTGHIASVYIHDTYYDPGWVDAGHPCGHSYFKMDINPADSAFAYYERDNIWSSYNATCVSPCVGHPGEWSPTGSFHASVRGDDGTYLYVVITAWFPGAQTVQGYIKVPHFRANFRSTSTVNAWLPSQEKEQGVQSTSDHDNVTEGTRSGFVAIKTNVGTRDSSAARLSFDHDLFRIGDERSGRWAHSWWVKGFGNLEQRAPTSGYAWLPPWGRMQTGINDYTVQVGLGQKVTFCQDLEHNREVETGYASGDPQIEVYNNGKSNACAEVSHPFNFKLTIDAQLKTEHPVAGTYTDVNYHVYNEPLRQDIAHTASPNDTQIKVISFLTDNIPDNGFAGTGPSTSVDEDLCTYFQDKFGGKVSNCREQHKDSEIRRGFEPGTTSLSISGLEVDDIDANNTRNKFCVATAVNPYFGDSTSDVLERKWNISNVSCRTIVKEPSVAFKLGNLYSSDQIVTSVVNKTNGKQYGSWSEYLALSQGNESTAGKGSITGFGSGSTLRNGLSNNVKLCSFQYSPLSMANFQCKNEGDTKKPGNATGAIAGDFLMRVMELYKTAPRTSGDIRGADGFRGTAVYYSDNEDPNSYVTITGNLIADDGPYTKANEIPQRIIIAPNIKIEGDVNRIDAWLIAYGNRDDFQGGTIDTCANKEIGEMGLESCGEELIVNGTVVSKQLLLKRGFGARGYINGEDHNSDPAEIIRLTPATYIWASDNSKGSDYSQAHTVYSKELAPRL